MTFVSYAQAREDVLLHRALHHVDHQKGYYIDVGGFDPDYDSVTRHFYEHGWHGINIEPNPSLFAAFPEKRPRDINIQAAITDISGVATLHEIPGNTQLCTLEKRFADLHESAGWEVRSFTVPALTLTEVCEMYVQNDIHFLKIDVEGHEAGVLRGMDFEKFRPWILVIESAVPNDLNTPTYEEWEGGVLSASYKFAYTDRLNRYYIAEEHSDLLKWFSIPADDYIYSYMIRERDEARRERDEALRKAGERT